MSDHSEFMGWGGFMGLLWIVLLGVVVWVVIGMARGGRGQDAPTAREILDRRYARGEIDADEYKRRRDDLGDA